MAGITNGYTEILDWADDFVGNLQNFYKVLSPYDYSNLGNLTKLMDYARGLFKLCPFSPGDRVVQVSKIDFGKAPGWKSSEHFLIPGSTAVVKAIDWNKDQFIIWVIYDNDSYVSSRSGEITKTSSPGLFCMRARHFRAFSVSDTISDVPETSYPYHTVRFYDLEGDSIKALVPSWDKNRLIDIPTRRIPQDILKLWGDLGHCGFNVEARVNVKALVPSDLDFSDWRLALDRKSK